MEKINVRSKDGSVLGPVPIFKPARQKDRCKRAVPCRAEKKWQAMTCPKRYSVNGAIVSEYRL